MNNEGSNHPISRWLIVMVILLCSAQCCLLLSRIQMDDDNLYLSYLSERRSNSEAGAHIEQAYVDQIKDAPGCERAAWRFKFRAQYGDNYPLLPWLESQARNHFFSPTNDLTTWVLGPMLASRIAMLLLTWGLVACALSRLRDVTIRQTIIVGLGVAACINIAATHAYFLLRTPDYAQHAVFAKIVYHVGKWHIGGGPFGDTPRNGATVLFLLALILKWSGYPRLAALSLLSISFMHRTYAGLMLVLFSGLMIFTAREQLRQVSVKLLMVGCFLVYLLRERYWDSGTASVGLLIPATLAYGLLLHLAAAQRLDTAARTVVGPATAYPLVADALLLLLACALVTLMATMSLHFSHDPQASGHFWGELQHRLPMICEVPVILGLIQAIESWRQRRMRVSSSRALMLASSLLALVFVGAALRLSDPNFWNRASESLRRLQVVSEAVETRPFNPAGEEARIYLSLLGALAPDELGIPTIASRLQHRRLACEGGE